MRDAAEPPIERVRIERRGGLAGRCTSVECAYAALSGDARAALHQVLAAHAAGAAPHAPGADRFRYRLALAHADGAARTLEVGEDAMPAALAHLVRPTLP